MTGKTHMVGGLVLCQALDSYVLTQAGTPLFYISGVGGALLPDICHAHSKIGRRLPIVSRVIAAVFGHRTFTHSLLFLVLVSFLLNLLMPDATMVQLGILTGVISHVILDAWTARGVRLLYPLDLRIRFPLFIRTGGWGESVVLGLGVLFLAWQWWGDFIHLLVGAVA
ncbi:metal-dependent hydrolase [Shouchella shacheensis]|uniref:metal-dependent hydrolase n=1 Tax=Shouchella shacheensis TaxID=1649580 RepID=UPI0007404869|nr:metal-dependent hydrolase [Shouchella shacheensis]